MTLTSEEWAILRDALALAQADYIERAHRNRTASEKENCPQQFRKVFAELAASDERDAQKLRSLTAKLFWEDSLE